MPKSNKKRKNGKSKKYVPKPKGISKSKLEKLLQEFKKHNVSVNPQEIAEIRMDEAPIQTDDDSKTPYNLISSEEEINKGPVLNSDEISPE